MPGAGRRGGYILPVCRLTPGAVRNGRRSLGVYVLQGADRLLPAVAYADPWTASYEERRASLTRGHRRVAYLYETPDAATFRYRVYNMIQALREGAGDIAASYFTGDELDRVTTTIDMTDVLVVCRFRHTGRLEALITRARRRGIRIIFDIDDLVFDPDFLPLLVETMNQEGYPNAWRYWQDYIERMGKTLRLCDDVITTNYYLASRIMEFGKKPAYVIPNFLNKEQIAISHRIWQAKNNCLYPHSGPVYLGYFSGTPTHQKDFSLVSDTLASLCNKYPNINLVIVGSLEPSGVIMNYHSRMIFYPLQDFINLQRFIGMVDVNLVPLRNNPINNSKSELKYFEAGIVGTVTVASPSFAYAGAVRDGENGLLADATEWNDKLQTIIDSEALRRRMAKQARADTEERYTWHSQSALVKNILFP